MFIKGEFVKYMMPLDADYSYGVIREIRKGRAEVELKSYPQGMIVEIPYRYMRHTGQKRGDEVGG